MYWACIMVKQFKQALCSFVHAILYLRVTPKSVPVLQASVLLVSEQDSAVHYRVGLRVKFSLVGNAFSTLAAHNNEASRAAAAAAAMTSPSQSAADNGTMTLGRDVSTAC